MKLEEDETGLWEERCYGGRKVKLGNRVNPGLWKEEYTRGNPIFARIELGCLPHGFLF